jgi:flagellar biogenesis protein FliO
MPMGRLTRDLRWLLGVVLAGTALNGALAADGGDQTAPSAMPAESETRSADAPAFWNQQPSGAQPLESNHSQAAPIQFAPLQYPERAASASDAPAELAPAKQPLPLGPPSSDARADARWGKAPPLVTAAASLGIVLGLFLLVVWVARRGTSKTTALLPREAFEILGRAPLIGRQDVQLIHCGNKILLVYASPGGAQTLTEITDPTEVERLVVACQGPDHGGSPLRQFFGQFGNPPRDRRYFARHESAELDFAHLEGAHSGA